MTDFREGDRVHDWVLDETGIFVRYYTPPASDRRYAVVQFGQPGDASPLRIEIEDLTLVERAS